jgi:hypothetical protein
MAETFKDKLEDAGHKIDEFAQKAEHKAKETFGEAGPSGTVADIKEHMEVYASCGTKVGKVDHVEGSSIKLTRNDSPDGQHHLIPTSWVSRVDQHVHLSKDHVEVQSQWKPA